MKWKTDIKVDKEPFEGSHAVEVWSARMVTPERSVLLDSGVSEDRRTASGKVYSIIMGVLGRIDEMPYIKHAHQLDLQWKAVSKKFELEKFTVHTDQEKKSDMHELGGRLIFTESDHDLSPDYPHRVMTPVQSFDQDFWREMSNSNMDFLWNPKGCFWFSDSNDALVFKLTWGGK